MPKGSPNKQTIASEKYQKKAGYKAVTFKMKGDLPDKFSELCERLGRPKSVVIAELMEKFLQENETKR